MRFKFHILISMMSLVLVSCQPEDISKGPELSIASSDFKLEQPFMISDSTVDFQDDSVVTFLASFSELVNYRIEIKGLQSDAHITLSNIQKEASIDWDGRAASRFFKNENCTAHLYVLGKNEPIAALNFQIDQKPDPRGELIADFEPLGRNALVGFWEAPVNGEPTRLFCAPTDQYALEGDFGYLLKGFNHSITATRFLGLAFSKPINNINGTNNNGIKFRIPTTNPDELWFNIWIYGEGKDDSFMAIKFLQDDNLSGEHEGASENGFEYFIRDVSHHGWKSFSVRYDQLVTSGNREFGGAGDGIHRPETIAQIEYALWSKVNNKSVSIIMDYPIFTKNNPIQ